MRQRLWRVAIDLNWGYAMANVRGGQITVVAGRLRNPFLHKAMAVPDGRGPAGEESSSNSSALALV